MAYDYDEEMKRLLDARLKARDGITSQDTDVDTLVDSLSGMGVDVSGVNNRNHGAAVAAMGGAMPTAQQPPARELPYGDAPMVEAQPEMPANWNAYPQAKPRAPLYSQAELIDANNQDATRARSRGMEAAGRSLVAGLTQTQRAPGMLKEGDALDRLIAMKKSQQAADIQGRFADNQAARTSTSEEVARLNTENAKARLTISENQAKALEAERAAKRGEHGEEFGFKKERAKADDAKDWTRIRLQERGLEAKDDKATTKLMGGIPVDMEPDVGEDGSVAAPSDDDKKQVKSLRASQLKLQSLTKELRKKMAGAGTIDKLRPGAVRDSIKSLATQIQVEAKNVAELGALSGGDFAIMTSLAPDPTAVEELIKGPEAALAKLDNLDAWADKSLAGGMKSKGLRFKAAMPTPPPPPGSTGAPKEGDTKQVGGKTYVRTPDGWALAR